MPDEEAGGTAGDSHEAPARRPIDLGLDIGHVHLKVVDLERSLDFYRGVFGSESMQRHGTEAGFVSAGPQEEEKVHIHAHPLDVEALLAEAVK
jgi:catechol 2,3-dioxygenase-like lactoylglutathione lyase family enzyme